MSSISRMAGLLFALAVALGSWQNALSAAPRSLKIETRQEHSAAGVAVLSLLVNGEAVAALPRANAPAQSLEKRLALAAAGLSQAYRDGKLSFSVAEAEGGASVLLLNGASLLSLDSAEAETLGAEAAAITRDWQNSLSAAFGLNAPGKSKAKQAAEGEAQTINAGLTTGEPPLAPVDDIFAGLNISGGHVVYQPPSEISIAPLSSPADFTAVVTGRASEDAARIALEWALRSAIGAKSSDRISWRGLMPEGKTEEKDRKVLPPLAVAPGEKKTVELEYILSSFGEPKSGMAKATIENRKLKMPRESLTYFSNAPEGVKKAQLLYYASLASGVSGRLVFHHQNQSNAPLQFYARVVNEGSETAVLHVIPGACGPDINTYFVGFKSAENFWANLNNNVGYLLRIPPGKQATLIGQGMKVMDTCSGYYKLTNLSRAPLRIETVCLPPGSFPSEGAYSKTDDATNYVYPEPFHNTKADYVTGDDWLYLRLGAEYPASLDGSQVFYGMYGVTHSFTVNLINDDGGPRDVYVILRGSAGEVKGQFFIDDQYISTLLVKGGDEQPLKKITLGVGETRKLRITAMPLNGGFYPASIILRESLMP